MENQISSPHNAQPIYRLCDAVLRGLLRRVPAGAAAERVALWWGYRFRPAPRRVKLRSGALLQTNGIDHLQLLLYYLGTFEPHCLAFLGRLLSPGDTMLDVGANVGQFTVEGARAVGAHGRVVAIEAAPRHVAAIGSSISANNLSNVTVFDVAAGAVDGTARLTLPRNSNLGMFTLGNVVGDDFFDVDVRRIDDLLAKAGVSSLGLIKIDIEGSETNALRGAVQTLARFRPAILIELNESALVSCGSSARELKDFLATQGYRGWRIARDGTLMAIVAGDTHACDECLFLPDGRSPPAP